MNVDFAIRDMLGDDLADAIDAARGRLSDDTISARIENGLVIVSRAGADVTPKLAHDEGLAALADLV